VMEHQQTATKIENPCTGLRNDGGRIPVIVVQVS
jgi:hypothetical protein